MTGWVMRLTRSVDSEVSGPTEELSDEQVVACNNWRVFQSLSKLVLSEFGDATVRGVSQKRTADSLDTGKLLVKDSWKTKLLSGLGHKDLISGQVAGSGMVSTVRDSPRVVRNQKCRVDEPSDSVVDGL